MSHEPAVLLAHAAAVPARERAALARELRRRMPIGETVLLETCHRVELYASEPALRAVTGEWLPPGSQALAGRAAARHLVRLAVGRESAVVAEDQLLHQLRAAVQAARTNEPLPQELDRLFDVALRAGRRARSWLPARRPSLAEAALDRVLPERAAADGPVLIVGSGEMGRRAARAVAQRGMSMLVSSRTPERAAGLAGRLGVRAVPFDPGPELAAVLSGAVLALSGPWPASQGTQAALLHSGAWVIDLSAPSCLPGELVRQLGPRLLSIDALAATPPASRPSQVLLDKLDALVDEALAEYEAWEAHESQRSAARALAHKAQAARAAELDALWQRMPQLADEQREEVERMARHLTERLLRDPLERLQQDGDGRHASAARELFRL